MMLTDFLGPKPDSLALTSELVPIKEWSILIYSSKGSKHSMSLKCIRIKLLEIENISKEDEY